MFSAVRSISLRQKVITGWLVVYLFMAATIAGNYYLTRSLEQKLAYLEDVSKMEESVLEIRRFEKNYFLYGDKESLTTAIYHLRRVESLLEKNLEKIEALSSQAETEKFSQGLRQYDRFLVVCSTFPERELDPASPDSKSDCESAMRKIGSSLAQFAEKVAKKKRDSIRETMSVTVTLPLLGLVVVGCGLAAIGSFLFAKVTKSLRLLESGAQTIAQGTFEPIENLPAERDIRNILLAFNSVGAQLREREEQLVQSKKLVALGTMLAGVAHEVNNPLSNISSSCEILLEELDDSDKEFQRALLTKVVQQVERARTLILNLLEFSRAKELHLEEARVKEIIEDTISSVSAKKPDQISLKVEVDDTLRILADRRKMEQALTNLVANAFQAIEGKGEVRVRALSRRDGMIKIRVSDTGEGIAEQDLARVFDPFFTTKDVGKGTGLGLFITHDIIVRHKGAIQVKSVLGKGTTFSITLPAAELPR